MENLTTATVLADLQNVCDDLQRARHMLQKGMVYTSANILSDARARFIDTYTRFFAYCATLEAVKQPEPVRVSPRIEASSIPECTCGASIPPHTPSCPRYRNIGAKQ